LKKRIVTIALAVSVCFSSQSVAYAWQDAPLLQEDVLVEESLSGPVTREAECPSPAEAYEAMIALKDREERLEELRLLHGTETKMAMEEYDGFLAGISRTGDVMLPESRRKREG